MIYCNNTIYAKVWSVTKSDKYILLNLGTPIVAFCYWFYKACTAGR